MARAATATHQIRIGTHDWYQEGAEYLMEIQDPARGCWRASGTVEINPLVGTSFALLFLSSRPASSKGP